MRRLHRFSLLPALQQALNPGIASVSPALVHHHAALSTSCPTSKASNTWSFSALAFGLAAAATSGLVYCSADNASPKEDDQKFRLLGTETRKRIFFKYEKRIREYSNLEKVFEYFGERSDKGAYSMSARDLLHSIVPTYPPQDSHVERAGNLEGEPKHDIHPAPTPRSAPAERRLLEAADVDSDGQISYSEWLLLLALLSIPDAEVKTVFEVVDLDGNGTIDAKEFGTVMDMLQAKAGVVPMGVARPGYGKMIDTSHGAVERCEYSLYTRMFGTDDSSLVQLEHFMAFLRDLHKELVQLEFEHYDFSGSGTISATDFAASLVTSADLRTVDKLLDKAQALPAELASKRISWGEFSAFSHLRRHHRKLAVAIDFCESLDRELDQQEFARLAQRVTGLPLSPAVVAIMYIVFGAPDGSLDTKLLFSTIGRRELLPGKRRMDGSSLAGGGRAGGGAGLWGCLRHCAGFGQAEEAEEV